MVTTQFKGEQQCWTYVSLHCKCRKGTKFIQLWRTKKMLRPRANISSAKSYAMCFCGNCLFKHSSRKQNVSDSRKESNKLTLISETHFHKGDRLQLADWSFNLLHTILTSHAFNREHGNQAFASHGRRICVSEPQLKTTINSNSLMSLTRNQCEYTHFAMRNLETPVNKSSKCMREVFKQSR